MFSSLNIRLIGFLVCLVIIARAAPLLETSDETTDDKAPTSSQQLYEMYKIMRTDPRLVNVSNNDIVSYIYRTYVLGNGDAMDIDNPKYPNHRRQRKQKTVHLG